MQLAVTTWSAAGPKFDLDLKQLSLSLVQSVAGSNNNIKAEYLKIDIS
jgi:hypothetical protein